MWKHTTSSTVTLLPIDSKPFSLEPYHNHNAAQNYWRHNCCVRSTILHDTHSQCTECLHTQIKGLWNTIHHLLYHSNAHSQLVQTLNELLQHVLVHVYHLQGEHIAIFLILNAAVKLVVICSLVWCNKLCMWYKKYMEWTTLKYCESVYLIPLFFQCET
jgi:ABC-type proline/glycine betaine transport system permease subunit